MNERTAKWIGGLIGAIFMLVLFVCLPMKRNYDQCGRIWFAPTGDPHE